MIPRRQSSLVVDAGLFRGLGTLLPRGSSRSLADASALRRLSVMFLFTASAHFNTMRPDLVRDGAAVVPDARTSSSTVDRERSSSSRRHRDPGPRDAAARGHRPRSSFFIALFPANVSAALRDAHARTASP